MHFKLPALLVTLSILLAACAETKMSSGNPQNYISYESGNSFAGTRNEWRVQSDDIVVIIEHKTAYINPPRKGVDIRKTGYKEGVFEQTLAMLKQYGFSGLPEKCTALQRGDIPEPADDAGFSNITLALKGETTTIPIDCGRTSANYNTMYLAITDEIVSIVENVAH